MEKSKLVLLFRTLKKGEWNRLLDFIRSPYFNKDPRLVQMVAYFSKLDLESESTCLKKEIIFKAIFPKQSYNKTYFNHLQNYLLRLVEQYLAHDSISANKLTQDQIVLKTYLERRLEKHYDFKLRQVQRSLEQVSFRDERYFYQQLELAKTENERFIVQNQRVAHSALEDAHIALDNFYIAQKLDFLAEIIDRHKKFPQSYNVRAFELLEPLIQSIDTENIPSILVYQQLVQMLINEDDTWHFDQFRILLEQNSSHIKPKDLKRLFFFAINYCVRKIATGQAFQQQLLALYTSGLENGTLLDQNEFSPWIYKNVIQLGLALGKTNWVEQFIENYAPKLPSHLRKDAYYYNLAALHYSKDDYEQAMLYLNKVQYSDISYKLWSKELLLKLYYELGELEALHSLIISFEKLIKRNRQVPKPQKDAYRNFLRIVSKLLRRNYKKEQLRKEIESINYIRERKWLLMNV